MEKDHQKGENNFWFKMVTNRDGIRLCKELAYSVSRIKVYIRNIKMANLTKELKNAIYLLLRGL